MVELDGCRIRRRVVGEFFDRRLIDNTLRGYWCEAMVAEALGPSARIVSSGWHPWDIQIGPDTAVFPERIRIQVKNSAYIQSWHSATDAKSNCQFGLVYRHRPWHLGREVPCEASGFLCDLFALCLHGEPEFDKADHREPRQWRVFLLPVVGIRRAVTDAEISDAGAKLAQGARSAMTIRRPETLPTGLRGRPPVHSMPIAKLSLDKVKSALGLCIDDG